MKPPEITTQHLTCFFLIDFKKNIISLSYIVISHMKRCVNASWRLEFSILSRVTQLKNNFFFCTPTFKLVPARLTRVHKYRQNGSCPFCSQLGTHRPCYHHKKVDKLFCNIALFQRSCARSPAITRNVKASDLHNT